MLVRHAGGSYAVIVRAGARELLPALLAERHPGFRPVVIADAAVLDALGSPLDTATVLPFPPGERSKGRDTWTQLTDQLVAMRCDRRTVIVAYGGGVATDLGGFVAATFLRGVPWLAIPTTTLGMLDAAVGGKTGVNTPAGKNLVGAFHPPSAVLCDPLLLRTLPQAPYRDGLAEAAKHAATLDARYGAWIEDHAAEIADREPTALEELIHRSIELKAQVVTEDEHEDDRRAVLNAGHTVAHGLERASDYALTHGSAVAIGLIVETRLAEAMGIAAPGTAGRIASLLHRLNLPTTVPRDVDIDHAIDAMQADKKNRDGVVCAALIGSFGGAARFDQRWTHPVDMDQLRAVMRQCLDQPISEGATGFTTNPHRAVSN